MAPDKKALQNKLRSAQVDRMSRLNKDPMLSYAEELSRLYSVLRYTINKMDIALDGAEDYPAELSKDDAVSVRAFLKDADVLIESEFEFFVKFSDK